MKYILIIVSLTLVGCAKYTYTWKLNPDTWSEDDKKYTKSFVTEKYPLDKYVYLSSSFKILRSDLNYVLKQPFSREKAISFNNNSYGVFQQKKIVYENDTLFISFIHVTPGDEYNDDVGFSFFYSYKYGILIKREWIDLWGPDYILNDVKYKCKHVYNIDFAELCDKIFNDEDFFPNHN